MALSPVRLNHAVLFRVRPGTLGSLLLRDPRNGGDHPEPRANAAFLRLAGSGNRHDLGLFGVGSAGGPRRRGTIGLYHLAWQADTIDDVAAARQSLLEHGTYTGESDHGPPRAAWLTPSCATASTWTCCRSLSPTTASSEDRRASGLRPGRPRTTWRTSPPRCSTIPSAMPG
jgi:hypothetical protein